MIQLRIDDALHYSSQSLPWVNHLVSLDKCSRSLLIQYASYEWAIQNPRYVIYCLTHDFVPVIYPWSLVSVFRHAEMSSCNRHPMLRLGPILINISSNSGLFKKLGTADRVFLTRWVHQEIFDFVSCISPTAMCSYSEHRPFLPPFTSSRNIQAYEGLYKDSQLHGFLC